MAKKTRNQNNIRHGTIELVLLLLLQSGKKYGYQLAQELSDFTDGEYELKEATMYPTLYRMSENGYLNFEKVKIGERRTRVYYFITEEGKKQLEKLKNDYFKIVRSIDKIIQNMELDKKNTQES